MVKCPGKAGSGDLVWQIIQKANAFTLKGRGGDRKIFSTEAGNLTNTHSYSASGIANKKWIGVTAGEKGAVLTYRVSNSSRKVKGTTTSVTLTRGARKGFKATAALTTGSYYRGDLQSAALARVSRILDSQKPRKAEKKKTRGRKAVTSA